MKKIYKRISSLLLAAVLSISMQSVFLASDVEAGENSDDVVISETDKPYLALGADLTADQQHTVLELMGIEAANLDQYDVVYVNNAEEHEYLDAYIPSSEIGSKSLSSVVITKAGAGSGISISTYNINYCTVGMYKNALATAGVQDANIIVAGPFSISGTAALVGTFKAYKEMTGEELDQAAVDAAMDELVTTGELIESVDGDSQSLEAMIADLKEQIASGDISTEEEIRAAIEEAAGKYDISLSEEDIQKLSDLLKKLEGLDLDWDAISNQAQEWADQLSDIIHSEGFGEKIINFFKELWEAIKSLFS